MPPSFDIVSEVDLHEAANAVDQANREVGTRFDFKGTGAKFEQKENVVTMHAQSEFQLKQMFDILQLKLTKRGIDITCLKVDDVQTAGKDAKQVVTLRQGIDQPLAKKVVQLIKDSKMKVQASIQGEQVRITGKKKDDLQDAMTLLRKNKLDLPLQFNNFRD